MKTSINKNLADKNLVFLVDDSELFLELIEKHLLEFPESTFMRYSSGEQCLKNLNLNPDIIILDYELSENESQINGIDVLKTVKKLKPETQVIMVSSHENLKLAVSSIKHGAFDYVIKDEKMPTNIRNKVKNTSRKIRMLRNSKAAKALKLQIAALVAISITVSYFYF